MTVWKVEGVRLVLLHVCVLGMIKRHKQMKMKLDYKKVVILMVGGGVLYLPVELNFVQCLRDVAPLHTKGSHIIHVTQLDEL